ncbi:MAG: phosphotransferase [Bacteroidaceae bacterium]|nr:phosphotransferase [Bacteroidaceae bacterium]
MQRLVTLYKQLYSAKPASVEPITGSGSPRQYYRLSNPSGHSVIGTLGTSLEENRAFIGLTHHFEECQLPVPHILAVSQDQMAYLQSDLGSTSLYQAISQGRESGGHYSPGEQQLLRQAIAALPRFQIIGARGLDTTLCYPTPQMDATSIMFDLNYFKYCFIKLLPAIDFNELSLQHDMEHLTTNILALSADGEPTLILRDCQARNVMLANQQPHFIDYQGCRLGPVEYDLASFLWQASARYPAELRDQLINTYVQASSELRPTDGTLLRQRLRLMVLFRLLQVLGAYGFRGLHERKDYFLRSIPPALANLQELLATGAANNYPYLEQILNSITNSSLLTPNSSLLTPNSSHLTVTIYSFSYKKGIPADPSGNGGGYVFDCRSTHNPGRYEPYKQLTGLDREVIDFLESDGEILRFLNHVYPLAEHHTETYIRRGFTSLMFSFGCTGGQHRSVYSAQHLAEHLRRLYPQIKIHLIHREQGIDQYL